MSASIKSRFGIPCTSSRLAVTPMAIICLLLLCLVALAGCGNKGALYLKDDTEPVVSAEETSMLPSEEEEPQSATISAGGL